MELGRRSYEMQWLSVLFEVIDGEERLVCGISLEELDPNQGGAISGDAGLELFDEKSEKIIAQAEIAVERAKANGVRHVTCAKNDPIFISLVG